MGTTLFVQAPYGRDLVVTGSNSFPSPPNATDPVNADVYWRKVGEPFVSNKHLGTFRVGTDVDFHLNFPDDTDVVLTTMTRGPRGQRMFIDPSDAPSTVVRIPGIGGGTPSSFRIADEGVLLTQRGTLNFIGGAVTAVDNSGASRTDVTITAGFPNFANQDLGVPARSEINLPLPFLKASDHNPQAWLELQRTETGCYNAVTDLNCSGDPRYYKANWSAGSGTVTILAGAFWDSSSTLATLPAAYWHQGTVHTFRQGQGVRVQGAGAAGADLFTTVTGVSGSTLTLATVPSSNGAPGLICHDETSAIQAALNMAYRVHFPTGRYLVYSELRFPETLSGNYDGLELTGDGERNSMIVCCHDGHGIRMDQAMSGGGLVHVRIRDLGVIATQRQNKDALSSTQRGAGLAFTCTTMSADGVPEGDTTDLKLDHVFIQGFGYGILSQNTQTGYLGHVTVWYHKYAGIALIGNNNDLGTSQKEPNAIQIHDSFCQYGQFLSDSRITGTGSIAARSRTLTMGGVSSSRIGCVIKIAGAGVGGRTHATFIENVSGSTITISMPCYAASSSSSNVTVYGTNVGNIYLHNANNIEVAGGTHQGNWDNGFSAAISDACGIRAESLTALRVDNLWYEDVGGENGASIDLYNTKGVFISGCHVGGAKKSSPELPSGHGVAVRLTDAEGTDITGTYFGQSGTGVWLQLNGRCKGTRVASSVVPNPEMYNNTAINCEFAVLEDSCINPVGLDLNRETRRLIDDLWGQGLKNPRFLDRTGSNPTDWTVVNAAFSLQPSTAPSAWLDRWDAYLTVNTQAQAASGEGDILTQVVAVPDSDRAGEYTLGFDAYMTTRGSGGATDNFQAVRLVSSVSGPDSSQYFQMSGAPEVGFFTGRWQRYQLRCRVPAGTGRTLTVGISSTRGGNTPVVRYGNFRLQRGRASTHDADGVVSERGGIVRAPLAFASTTSPAVSAPGQVTLANVGGVLSASTNGGAYAALGGGGGANVQLSNLSINAADSFQSNVALNAWLFPGTDAYTAATGGLLTAVGLGKSDKLLSAAYFLNGVFVYPIGSNTLAPKAFGFMGGHATTRGEFFGSEATRFLLLKDRDSIQTGYASRTQLSSYHGIEIRGNRRTDTAPGYSNPSGGNDNLNTVVYSETNCLGFIVDSVPGVVQATWPIVSFRRSNVEFFRFGYAGDLRFAGGFEPSVVACDAARSTIFEYEPFTFYRVDSSGGLRTIRLPRPYDVGAPRVVWIRKTNGAGGSGINVEVMAGGTVEGQGATWAIPGSQPSATWILVGIPDSTNSNSGTWYFG